MSMDIQKLKVLAEAATNGPWIAGEEHESQSFEGYTVGDSEGWVAMLGTANEDGRNADFIAAANPAAVLDLIAKIERLQRFEIAYQEFSDKTDWVQETAHWSELGMHRADVLRKRCDDLNSHNQAQADEIVRLRKAGAELIESAQCHHLHHEKADQHEPGEPCGAVARLTAAFGKESRQ